MTDAPCSGSKVSQLGIDPCVMSAGHDGPHTCTHGGRF